MLEHKIGNLLRSDLNVIIHGVNCQGVMGSGIAKQIRETYPEVYQKYKEFCDKGDKRSLLGKVQYVVTDDRSRVVINAFTQFNYGIGIRQVSYDAVDECMNTIERKFTTVNPEYVQKVGLPRIGAGLGGGHWAIIEEIIKANFKQTHAEIYSLEGN